MAIPESQLDTWAHQGAVKQSRDTYATIKNALGATDTAYVSKRLTSFLQGSYGNDTNIYVDSDVDVVLRLDSTYYYDLSKLPPTDQSAYQAATSAATYSLQEFKGDVIDYLRRRFTEDVQVGKKAIHVKANGSRRDADVLVCAKFRRYYKFMSLSQQEYVEGICFFPNEGARIENFPRQHAENCTAKHQGTKKLFKPMVRILKNMRNRMMDKGLITNGLAPSYYLEGLLYNVPNDKFDRSYTETFISSVNWILQADRSQFVCANNLHYLLREGSPVTWRDAQCTQFLNSLCEFWKQW